MENLKPSLIIIILILVITVLLSVSLCLLLRHLSTVTTADSRRFSSHRVSPENPAAFSVFDSLPLFTFSSVTRRSSSGGDCAICLLKFEPDDQLRLLPLCCHAFHASCIDTWLASNMTCPLCRSPIAVTETDVMKIIQASSFGGGSDSFRLEIGSISRRQAGNEPAGPPQRRFYSLGSFDYIVDEESDISTSQIQRRSVSDKEEVATELSQPASESNLAPEVTAGWSWLKDYVDRLSFSLPSRAMSFRSSGRFFTGSSRRSDIVGVGEYDVESNRVGEEISEYFRWFSGV